MEIVLKWVGVGVGIVVVAAGIIFLAVSQLGGFRCDIEY